jgi:hypothetical protein
MAAVPISRRSLSVVSGKVESNQKWTHLLAAGSLVTGGVLIAAGHRRAGLTLAASGAAIAAIEEREAIETLWKNLPGFLRDAQGMLDRLEGYLSEAAAQGHKLQGILRR